MSLAFVLCLLSVFIGYRGVRTRVLLFGQVSVVRCAGLLLNVGDTMLNVICSTC